MAQVDFRPSRHGWHFANSWLRGAPAGFAGVTLARVYGGLCGGMCVLARQHWLDGDPITPDRQTPSDGPLTSALWQGQLVSLKLPFGPLRYLRLQLPTAADQRRRSTLANAVPAVGRELRAGRPALLGLIRAVSWNPGVSGRHHVALAYALAVDRPAPGATAETVTLSVYDPNHPDDDSVRLTITPDGAIAHSASRLPVYALLSLD